MRQFGLIWILALLCALQPAVAATPTLRAGVLKFGTVNWELQTIKQHRLDEAEGFHLEVTPYAGKLATTTALHGGAVDVIVNDWLWVSRQRSAGRGYGFIPYSRMNGALMVAADSGIASLAELQGKKVGIAGGPVDKSWLLIQALARQQHHIDLKQRIDAVYGAPPLLAKKLQSGELDAVITFWHYAARLEAAGFRRLVDIGDALEQLGMPPDVPMVGYVFSPALSDNPGDLVQAFDRAARRAKAILATQPDAWLTLEPLMNADSAASLQTLKAGYKAGIPTHWGEVERRQAANLFSLLAELGGEPLVGKATALAPGTFIEAVRY
ncbi:ABC transporter substrate-binding protein [Sedimenticola hydrogenitrophicus]|uniref:ABC transporter substrate-binding protein n=1 Tax=Sedimenticola hydrogenitrophicus TaxID=2967975 RepID=UPI0021A4CFDB|nr:ABC transporter substrate-binding protein [Sedimenticola hydrogenitrophicus]